MNTEYSVPDGGLNRTDIRHRTGSTLEVQCDEEEVSTRDSRRLGGPEQQVAPQTDLDLNLDLDLVHTCHSKAKQTMSTVRGKERESEREKKSDGCDCLATTLANSKTDKEEKKKVVLSFVGNIWSSGVPVFRHMLGRLLVANG